MGALPVGANALIFAQRYETHEAESATAIVISTFALRRHAAVSFAASPALPFSLIFVRPAVAALPPATVPG